MRIQSEDFSRILALYNIKSPMIDNTFFIHSFDPQELEFKVIAKIDFANRTPLVVKLIHQNKNPRNEIEAQSQFSEHLRHRGVITPMRYKTGDFYCGVYHFKDLILNVIIEDYLGDEITSIHPSLAFQIGGLMGKNHRIAEEDNLHIHAPTLFHLVGYNEVSGYSDFVKIGRQFFPDNRLFHDICATYECKLSRIRTQWHRLPKYATQGDYSINNLTLTDGGLGIFDYNNAGDEVLVGDMVLEGLLTAYEMDLADGLSDADRPALFESFIHGYLGQRHLSKEESAVFHDIYTLSNALWFTKIRYNESSLEQLIQKNQWGIVDNLLQSIYGSITCTPSISTDHNQ